MTPEQRLDRLERLARLLANAGLRSRSDLHQKYEILMDAQMRNEVRFARLAEAQVRLAESQTHTDQRLDALIEIIRQDRNAHPPSE